jgi:hypothetical protein
MGFYSEGPATSKAPFIVSEYDGEIIPQPERFEDIPADKALICVVDNVFFEAAGYCFSAREFEAITGADDIRPKKWLIMDKSKAEKLSGYSK